MTHMQILFAILKDELVKYAKDASRTFWEYDAGSGLVELPGSVTGQLGGPSQRRLPPALASAILQGVCFTGWINVVTTLCLFVKSFMFLLFSLSLILLLVLMWSPILPNLIF